MSNEQKWKFAKIAAIEEPLFNNILEKFYNLGVDGLIRENIQNSMDGKLKESTNPVEVNIEIGEIETDKIPGIEEIRERIYSLQGRNSYTKETILHMREKLKQKKVAYISFEDRNTKGLSGARNGQNFSENDTWGIYAYQKGVHSFDSNEEDESMRGGSYGVGKIASNAASDLYLMFFGNCDEENNQHLGGTVQLIEHSFKNQCYRATGYFTDEDGTGVFYPYENKFDTVFKKETRGLKIIIPFFREQYNDMKVIVRSVCDNFFIAILRNQLIVKVNDTVINSSTILDIIKDEDYYARFDDNRGDDSFTPLYIDTYLNFKPFDITIEDKINKYSFLMYFQFNKNIKKGRVAIIRRIGMKIEDKKIKNYANASFNAILIPKSDQEDKFLKSLENESHTALSSEHIKIVEKQRNAVRFINNISKSIGMYIAAAIEESNPSDGKIDTSDLLFEIENNFKKEISKDISTVKLTKGNEKSERVLVKVKTQSAKNKKRENKLDKELSKIKSILRKAKKKDGEGEEKVRVRFTMIPESVKRIVLEGKELLFLDLSQHYKYDGEKVCDMSISLIDGVGKEYDNEFSINTNYPLIIDKNTGKQCKVDRNIIRDISIQNSLIQLELKTSHKFNNSLKFIYSVEV